MSAACRFATKALESRADPDFAAGMQAYMKTDMPCYGVRRPDLTPIVRQLVDRWPPPTRAEYGTLVESLWGLDHREEKYLAIGLARRHDRFVTRTSLPLYKRMIRQGAWWDLVDEIAIGLVGRVLWRQRRTTTPDMRQWSGHPDLWVRRSAIISQVGHKGETDPELLFDICSSRAHEPEFFIRKAIGWALRDYSKTAPAAVAEFVDQMGDQLSGLSRREATKYV